MREVAPLLDIRAALALSDPPYRLTAGGRKTQLMKGCFSANAYDNSGELFPIVPWHDMAPLIRQALRPDADAIIMTSDREALAARVAFQDAGFAFHRTLVWDKVTATPNRWFMQNCEFALYLYCGRARMISDPGAKALIRCPQRDVSHLYIDKTDFVNGRRGQGHPTEKPVDLLASWINNTTEPGDLVFDPFMGTGSTLVAAARTGRQGVGIELDPKWFRVSCARVREAVERGQIGLFENAASEAVQGDMWA
jgi:site-specific DNA-methyltransferase (adenine-specific)